jgi:hypothetical protein
MNLPALLRSLGAPAPLHFACGDALWGAARGQGSVAVCERRAESLTLRAFVSAGAGGTAHELLFARFERRAQPRPKPLYDPGLAAWMDSWGDAAPIVEPPTTAEDDPLLDEEAPWTLALVRLRGWPAPISESEALSLFRGAVSACGAPRVEPLALAEPEAA